MWMGACCRVSSAHSENGKNVNEGKEFLRTSRRLMKCRLELQRQKEHNVHGHALAYYFTDILWSVK